MNSITVSPAIKKVASTAKKKPVSTTKKKKASPAKGKPVSIAKEKIELSKQVMDFIEASFKGRRIAYFVLETERTREGAYIVCVAIESEAGYYKMDWGWHCSFTKAKAETVLMNDKLGLNEEEVNDIIITTMGPPTYQ